MWGNGQTDRFDGLGWVYPCIVTVSTNPAPPVIYPNNPVTVTITFSGIVQNLGVSIFTGWPAGGWCPTTPASWIAYDENDVIVSQGTVNHTYACNGGDVSGFDVNSKIKRLVITPPDPLPHYIWPGGEVIHFLINFYVVCPPAIDPIFDLPIMRDSVRALWNLSNAEDPNAANRMERTGYLEQDVATGDYYFRFANIHPSDNPCASVGSVGAIPGRQFVAHVHTHPFKPNEAVPLNCGLGLGTYDNMKFGGPSGKDVDRAVGEYATWGISRFFIVDSDYIYSVPPGFTRKDMAGNVRRWARKQGTCALVP